MAAMLGLADPTWPENERAAYSSDDLQTLLARIGRENVSEIILALPATVHGQITSHYLVSRLKDSNVKVTTLAQGIPMGAELDYMDEGTIQLALNSRKQL